MDDLERELRDEMMFLYRTLKDDYRYAANRFLGMINNGARAAAIALVTADKPSKGFLTLKMFSRLDISVEAIVLRDEFRPLFSPDVLAAAAARLEQHGACRARFSERK